MAVKNIAASILSRLKNQAKEGKIPFQMVLQLFAQEEFLRKLSASDFADNLILKGGMFIYTLTEFDSRPTRDIDFLLKNLHGSLENTESIMKMICEVNTGNDFITLEVVGTEQISVEKKYPGIKTHFLGHISNVRIPFSIDVGIDDIIVPNPVKRELLTRLPDFKAPKVYTYSLESTIAEKFDAILQRMSGTSRMKDFYDIYYLSGIFNFDGAILQEAVNKTLMHRGRELTATVFDEIREFDHNTFLNTQWRAFEPAQNTGLEFSEALRRLEIFLQPVYERILEGSNWNADWLCTNKMWISNSSSQSMTFSALIPSSF